MMERGGDVLLGERRPSAEAWRGRSDEGHSWRRWLSGQQGDDRRGGRAVGAGGVSMVPQRQELTELRT